MSLPRTSQHRGRLVLLRRRLLTGFAVVVRLVTSLLLSLALLGVLARSLQLTVMPHKGVWKHGTVSCMIRHCKVGVGWERFKQG